MRWKCSTCLVRGRPPRDSEECECNGDSLNLEMQSYLTAQDKQEWEKLALERSLDENTYDPTGRKR